MHKCDSLTCWYKITLDGLTCRENQFPNENEFNSNNNKNMARKRKP